MKLKSLELHNFRGFQALNLPLPDARTLIFIGRNGVGKTSLLEAIAIMLSWLPARIKSKNSRGLSLNEQDIYFDANGACVKLEVVQGRNKSEWRLFKNRPGRPASGSSEFNGLNSLALALQTAMQIGADAPLPLVAYYPANRSVTETRLESTRKNYDQLDAFHNAFTKASSFNSFFEWFRNREDLENQQKLKQKNFYYQDTQLKAVRSAISAFLPEISELHVDREDPIPRLLAEKEGKTIVINQLSDGEKCLLGLVGDLARRLALANPALERPLTGEGIILIDEIELHLHPRWQRDIVPGLERTFPGCQFVVTTHSPQVLGDARDAAIFVVDIHGDEPVQNLQDSLFGRDTAHLLEEVMDASSRNTSVREKLDQLFLQLDENRTKEARDSLEALKGILSHDPELIRASVLLRRREKLER
ncbi:AAA family ATPase [Endozoicomonas sp. 4G]|uniref:AAA family ATPase n=1 Tax=Endozoicomonas sp. 4G TaxID=2872754 RepID=UPI00207876A0|nr:AAA family ATPase [Endozoicomonas sp. 4G]